MAKAKAKEQGSGGGGALLANAGGGALAVPDSLKGGAIVTGNGDRGPSLSRLALYQGTAEEVQKYGDGFKRGEFIDTLEFTSLGDSIKVMPVAGWYSWVRFDRGSVVPVYSERDRSKVPPEDLKWNDSEPPAATECVNMVLCVEGVAFPFVFVFKRTGLKAYNGMIGPMEARRGSAGRGPGFYELSSVDDKNPEGKPYRRLVARPCGEPPAELLELGGIVRAAYEESQSEFEKMADDAQGGDEIPI